MNRHQKVFHLVELAYTKCPEYFGKWMWKNHVPIVARKAELLAQKYEADVDLAVAGALLHDFGDAFVYRFHSDHEKISKAKAIEALKKAEYSQEEVVEILEKIIAPHSCRDGFLPETLEAKVLATADAVAHLTTDFYLQFTWMHLPEGKTYSEFLEWVAEKLERDFNKKIFFEEVKDEVSDRYLALLEVFETKKSENEK